jgi:hypothetical protein
MKIIVAGGRDFHDEVYMGKVLEELLGKGLLGKGDPELVCGMAKGADLLAKRIFESCGFIVHKRPADWKDMSEPCIRKRNAYGEYNALAGMKRNHAMGDEADVLVAFHDTYSTGTQNMINYMNKLGKPVYIFNY